MPPKPGLCETHQRAPERLSPEGVMPISLLTLNGQSEGVAPGTDYEIPVRGCWDSAQQKRFFFLLLSSCGLSADVL